jgi:hypothetical protein
MPDDPQPVPGATQPSVDATPEAAEEFKPSATDLVVSDPRDPNALFVVLDRHDEAQIISEFQRRALKVMLYDFTQAGTQLVDLSYQGVNEAVRLMNATGKCRIRIRPESLHVEEVTEDAGSGPERFYVATVYAEDEITGYGQYGTSTCPVMMKLRNGKSKWDVFARTKAINKAQRNALKVMVPEGMRQTMIAQYKGDDTAVRRIQAGAGAEALAELPPPLTDERAKKLIATAEDLYEQVKELAPGGVAVKVTPGYFFSMQIRAQHSHEMLESFVAYMREKLEEARKVAGA